MAAFFAWIENKFQHPVILFLVLVGVFFIFLGLAEDIPLLWFKEEVKSNPELRLAAMLFGSLLIFLAVVLMYRPPTGWQRPSSNRQDKVALGAAGPAELNNSHQARRSALSKKQKQILAFIEDEKKVPFPTIKQKCELEHDAELYYRLEQLRLLGFIRKERIGGGGGSAIMLYSLTDAYLAVVGEEKADQTHAVEVH